jgi:hypothetical protein
LLGCLTCNRHSLIPISYLSKRIVFLNIILNRGTGVKLLKNAPKHLMDAEDYEPLYVP